MNVISKNNNMFKRSEALSKAPDGTEVKAPAAGAFYQIPEKVS